MFKCRRVQTESNKIFSALKKNGPEKLDTLSVFDLFQSFSFFQNTNGIQDVLSSTDTVSFINGRGIMKGCSYGWMTLSKPSLVPLCLYFLTAFPPGKKCCRKRRNSWQLRGWRVGGGGGGGHLFSSAFKPPTVHFLLPFFNVCETSHRCTGT